MSMGFSRQEYWSGLPWAPPGDLPDSGMKLVSLNLLHWQADSLPLVLPEKPCVFSSAQWPVASDSLWPHGLQHTRPPCPSPAPRVYSNSCSLSQWCHPAISSSIMPFTSCPQSFPASRSFETSQLFASGGQKIWSFSFNISPSREYSGLISFRMDWFDLLAAQGTLRSLLQHHSSKVSILWHSAFFIVNSHIHTWQLEKPKPWLDRTCW